MQTIKQRLKTLLTRKKPLRITIEFIKKDDGSVDTDLKFNKDILVSYAAHGLDKFKALISAKLAHKITAAGYGVKNPKRREFIRKQTLGDIM